MEQERQGHEWQVRLNRQREQQAEPGKEPGPLDVPTWRELMERGSAAQEENQGRAGAEQEKGGLERD